MTWLRDDKGGEMLVADIRAYEAAIRLAPPGTLIQLGDLEATTTVRCTTCNLEMEASQAPFHKHIVECPTCKLNFDMNMDAHDAKKVIVQRGGGTIGYSEGCKENQL